MREIVLNFLVWLHIPQTDWVVSVVLVGTLLVTTLIVHLILTFFINGILKRLIIRSKHNWDDILFHSGIFKEIGHIVPLVILYFFVPIFFPYKLQLLVIAEKVLGAGIFLFVARGIAVLLDAINAIYVYANPEVSKKKPVKGYLQMLKIFVYIVAVILIITKIAGVSPVGILSGLGAMSAVLMLVFKDPIMGVVSSVQLSANDLVRIGDWIEMGKYNADGEVIDVTLQSVIVRNWDMTVTSIPIYALVSDSFKNWRGMSESPGRRVKKSLNIDMASVAFLTEKDLERLSKIRLLEGYLDKALTNVREYNEAQGIEDEDLVTSRRLTNLGTFRAYVTAYLKSLDWVEQSLTHMVRYLQPNEKGIALEIYFFSSNKAWVQYEGLQADILDHLLAILHIFNLRVYQNPTGWDVAQAVSKL